MRFRTQLLLGVALAAGALFIPHVLSSFAEEPTDEELFEQILDEIEEVAEAEGIDLDDVEIPPQPEDEVNEELGNELNAALAAAGLNLRAHSVETFTATNEPLEMGRLIFFSTQLQRLDFRFVPGDPRRAEWSGDPSGWDDLTTIIDNVELPTNVFNAWPAVSEADTVAAIAGAADTWNSIGPTIIPITQRGRSYEDVGLMQAIQGFGGKLENPKADIVHGGFVHPLFFERLRPGGATSILGIAVRFYFPETPTSNVPTDIDANGKRDAALVEIYYNALFPWAVGPVLAPPFDIQTTATHEMGHALSLHHFGTVFGTLSNGKLHFAPRAVMNAGYVNLLHEPTGRDVGLFNQFWAQWPQR